MSNLFACLDSDNDEPVVKKPVAAAGKDEKKSTAAGAKTAANGNDKNAGKSPAAAKPASAAGPKKDGPKTDRPQGDRPPKTDRPKSAPAAVAVEGGVEGGPPKEDARGGGRGGRGGKEVRNRGGRGNEEAPHREGADGVVRPPRKREYDRRSGTGRGREQSKGGRGAHGFGNEGQEAQEAEKDPASAEVPVEGAVEGEEEPAAAAEPVVEAEPEPPSMTMEEFLAQRAAARANTQLFGPAAVRKVETDMTGARTAKEDLGNWGGFGMTQVESEKQKEQRSHAKKQIVELGFKNAALEQSRDRDDDRPMRGGRGEGGRGGGRFGGRDGGRGGGRGGDRSSRGGSGGRGGYGGRGIDVNDANAFPSL